MTSQDEWAPWVTTIREWLFPYRRVLAAVSLVIMVGLILASVPTELWEPVTDKPKRLWTIAALIGLLNYMFLGPTQAQLQQWEWRQKSDSQNDEK